MRTTSEFQGRVVEFDEVSVEEAEQLLRDGAVLVDVRRDDERAEKYIEGSIHIPLHELEKRMHELPPGRVITVCSVGKRSAAAAELLEKAGGRKEVSSIRGGGAAWEVAGKPTVRP